ncbi:MAG: SMP-30/gluconolactonase/LRE family protein, partial [Acidobacteriota bacterium]|nr:SMP-30/gluconolactonase/LRE family protein [Acidobacteriota bacterium]
MRRLAFAFLLAVTAASLIQAQAQPGESVIRLDPALDAIISPTAKLEMLKTDEYGISEGPVWVRDGQTGYLLFSDIVANVVYKWTPDNKVSVYLKDSGYTGPLAKVSMEGYIARSGPLFVFDFGSNGLTLDKQGRLVLCAQGDRAIVRIEKDGTRTVLADRYEGKRLNRPNDLVMKSDGAVYFSDPHMDNPTMELTINGVFMAKDGKVQLLASDFRPNGLAFSPDEKILYLNGNGGIRSYDVRPDGTIENGRVFIDMRSDKTPGGPDGMKVDQKGNVYCTGPGGI